MNLPGSGEAHPKCGVPVRGVACPGSDPNQRSFFQGTHTRRVLLNKCHRSACPKCYGAWAHRAAERAAARLIAARNLYAAARRPGGGQIKHLILSPPAGGDLPTLHRQMRRELRRANWNGGVEIFHPWRTRARGKGRYRKGQNYESPHWHLVGFGHVDSGKLVELGWVVKNKGPRHSEESVRATIAYLLEHAGIDQDSGAHVIKWTGSASYNKIVRVTTIKSEETMTCECGTACLEYPTSMYSEDGIDWKYPTGTARERRVRLEYALRTARQITPYHSFTHRLPDGDDS